MKRSLPDILPDSNKKLCSIEKEDQESLSFFQDGVPKNHHSLGNDTFVVISDYAAVARIHIKKYHRGEDGRLLPTKSGITLSPFLWESLSEELRKYPENKDVKPIIINDSLMLSQCVINNEDFFNLQKYVVHSDFSRQFIPDICLLGINEFKKLKNLSTIITDNMFEVMFKNVLSTLIQKQCPNIVSSNIPEDVEIELTTSLVELLEDRLGLNIRDVFECDGCIENQCNQLAHSCMTYSNERRFYVYGNLALSKIDLVDLAKEFISKNIHASNYVKIFFDNLNVKTLIQSVENLYIASDSNPFMY